MKKKSLFNLIVTGLVRVKRLFCFVWDSFVKTLKPLCHSVSLLFIKLKKFVCSIRESLSAKKESLQYRIKMRRKKTKSYFRSRREYFLSLSVNDIDSFFKNERKSAPIILVSSIIILWIVITYLVDINTINNYNMHINPLDKKAYTDEKYTLIPNLDNNIFNRFDISQIQCEIVPFIDDIDTICVDFGVVTEFIIYSTIEPDKKNYSSIIFTDEDKIKEIKEQGLFFVGRFPERQNLQNIRMIALSAAFALFFQSTVKYFIYFYFFSIPSLINYIVFRIKGGKRVLMKKYIEDGKVVVEIDGERYVEV